MFFSSERENQYAFPNLHSNHFIPSRSVKFDWALPICIQLRFPRCRQPSSKWKKKNSKRFNILYPYPQRKSRYQSQNHLEPNSFHFFLVHVTTQPNVLLSNSTHDASSPSCPGCRPTPRSPDGICEAHLSGENEKFTLIYPPLSAPRNWVCDGKNVSFLHQNHKPRLREIDEVFASKCCDQPLSALLF